MYITSANTDEVVKGQQRKDALTVRQNCYDYDYVA